MAPEADPSLGHCRDGGGGGQDSGTAGSAAASRDRGRAAPRERRSPAGELLVFCLGTAAGRGIPLGALSRGPRRANDPAAGTSGGTGAPRGGCWQPAAGSGPGCAFRPISPCKRLQIPGMETCSEHCPAGLCFCPRLFQTPARLSWSPGEARDGLASVQMPLFTPCNLEGCVVQRSRFSSASYSSGFGCMEGLARDGCWEKRRKPRSVGETPTLSPASALLKTWLLLQEGLAFLQ